MTQSSGVPSVATVATVTGVTARAVVAPLGRPIRTAVGTIADAPLVLIDIRTSDGGKGSAYVFAYTKIALAALQRLVTEIGAELAGRPALPRDLMRHFDRRFRLLGWQGLVGMALSGLDMALWDALGRAAGQPVATLLGAAPKPLPAYDSYGLVDTRADLPALEASVKRGFGAIKIKLGEGRVEDDIAVMHAVRETIGNDVRLMVDFNQSLDAAEAIRRIRAIEPFEPYWIEEPVKAEDLAGHAQVRASVGTPIQTGENWWFPAGMAAALAAGACDFAMPDVMKIGGISGFTEAAALAAAAGVPLSSHLFIEASAHVLAAAPGAHFIEYLDLAGAVLEKPVEVVDGTISATGPGLGIEWNEAAIERYAAAL
jgi:mandelate racemase